LRYHNKALEIRKTIKEKPELIVHSLNNIGKVHLDNESYSKSINYFSEALTHVNILEKNNKLSAILIDNLAFARYKNGATAHTLDSLLIALKIREQFNFTDGTVISSLHLAEYYNNLENIDSALHYAERAKILSQKTGNYRDHLKSLKLLGDLNQSSEISKKNLSEYIRIKDSLEKDSQRYRDQFARIEFDVKGKNDIIQSQQDTIEKKDTITNSILMVIFGLAAIISGIFFYKFIQRKKIDNDFHTYLANKFKLHTENLELWLFLIEGLTQEEIANKIFRSVDTVKTRRRALYKKIRAVRSDLEALDKAKVILAYKDEQELHKKLTKK